MVRRPARVFTRLFEINLEGLLIVVDMHYVSSDSPRFVLYSLSEGYICCCTLRHRYGGDGHVSNATFLCWCMFFVLFLLLFDVVFSGWGYNFVDLSLGGAPSRSSRAPAPYCPSPNNPSSKVSRVLSSKFGSRMEWPKNLTRLSAMIFLMGSMRMVVYNQSIKTFASPLGQALHHMKHTRG